MGLRTGWINFLYNTSRSTKKVRSLLTPIGVIIFGIFVSLFILIALYVDKTLHLPNLNLAGWNQIISALLLILGIVFVIWSVFHFLKVKGTPVPMNPPPKLISTGPYAYTRNPMLTGVFFLLFGIGFLLGSFSLIFVFTPLFILANYWELKEIEEPELIKRFDAEYKIYKEKTPMFFPRLNQLFGKKS
jgi:protein-S-isoprenylcysteine O-methyltransferase Ste14